MLGLCLSPAFSPGQKQPPDSNLRLAEEDIRLAAFLYLLDVDRGPDPDYSIYCLTVDSNAPGDHHDPSDSLLKRFPQSHRTIRKFSECEVVKKPKDLFHAVKDRQSGKPAWMISLSSIEWVDEQKVRLKASRYCGGLCGWWSTVELTFNDGNWKAAIAPGADIFVS